MRLKKVIIVGAAVAMFAGSLLNVSAAGPSTSKYVKTLKASGKENLIIDVKAYKAAYSDLEKAFGNDEDAYIEHYLTKGVFEGRTKGVLFDPLAYAAAYGDVNAAFGNDISAIVDHYINFGIAENRTLGTANGYADIATAQKSGSPIIAVQREIYNTDTTAANGGAGATGIADSNILAAGSNYGITSARIAGSNTSAAGNGGAGVVANTNSNSVSPIASSAPAVSNTPAVSGNTNTPDSNRHTTSIYESGSNGDTLIRVEYYDDNNRLYEYSDVKDYDAANKSYTETVYRYDEENQTEVVTRTDTYENGQLVSSVTP